LSFGLLFAGAGCQLIARHPTPTPGDASAETDGHAQPTAEPSGFTSVFNRPLKRLVVEFRVHRISAPQGAFAPGSGLWKIPTGGLPDADAVLRLTANGFRAAVGRESDRPALKAFIEDLQDLRTAVDDVTPGASRLVYVELGPCAWRESVFFYDRRGRLHGLDFVNPTARFRLAFELRTANLKEVRLHLAPELREPPGPLKWIKGPDGQFRQVPEQRGRTFDELAFDAAIPEGGFLLLAATPAVRRRPLLARPFFIRSTPDPKDGKPIARESIYIISPMIRSYTGGSSRGGAKPPGPEGSVAE